MLKNYYYLTKPGIIYGNALTTAGGFLLAWRGLPAEALAKAGHINFGLFLATLLGISLVVASACVFNNVIDRDIDAKMPRTQNRALVTGLISKNSAIVYGFILGLVGFEILWVFTSALATFIAFLGWFVYIFLYSPLKPRSVHATLIGSIAGAAPPVVGYSAVTNNFDAGAIILFLILVFWQMPHFYAIAIRRLNEYQTAGIPVLPAKKGIFLTKINMLLYITGFILAAATLSIFGYTGKIYLTAMLALGAIWLYLCMQGFRVKNDKLWARRMFLFSLVVIVLFCILIGIGV